MHSTKKCNLKEKKVITKKNSGFEMTSRSAKSSPYPVAPQVCNKGKKATSR